MSELNYGNMSNQGSKYSEQDEEERKADAELAVKMSNYIDPAIDKIRPFLKLILDVCGRFILNAVRSPKWYNYFFWSVN